MTSSLLDASQDPKAILCSGFIMGAANIKLVHQLQRVGIDIVELDLYNLIISAHKDLEPLSWVYKDPELRAWAEQQREAYLNNQHNTDSDATEEELNQIASLENTPQHLPEPNLDGDEAIADQDESDEEKKEEAEENPEDTLRFAQRAQDETLAEMLNGGSVDPEDQESIEAFLAAQENVTPPAQTLQLDIMQNNLNDQSYQGLRIRNFICKML
jgi:hypothetical protein